MIEQYSREEGRRSGQQFLLNGVFPPPQLRRVEPGEVVLTHNLVDFQRESPAWRFHMLSEVTMSVCETDEKNHHYLALMYESSFRTTAWGALHFALSGDAPESAQQTAVRLKAVLTAWESLRHGRYLHRELNTFLDLEGLLSTACGWALDAWCPEAETSLRSRFEVASDRMFRATREACVEAILRQHTRILSFVDRKKLKHPATVTRLDFWRERLAHMDASSFERVSGVHPGEVLGILYQWDRELDLP